VAFPHSSPLERARLPPPARPRPVPVPALSSEVSLAAFDAILAAMAVDEPVAVAKHITDITESRPLWPTSHFQVVGNASASYLRVFVLCAQRLC